MLGWIWKLFASGSEILLLVEVQMGGIGTFLLCTLVYVVSIQCPDDLVSRGGPAKYNRVWVEEVMSCRLRTVSR